MGPYSLEKIIASYKHEGLLRSLTKTSYYIIEPIFYMSKRKQQVEKQVTTFWLMEGIAFFLAQGDIPFHTVEKLINFGKLQIPILTIRYITGMVMRYRYNKKWES